MKLERGVRQVTCRECGAEGEVRIGSSSGKGRQVKVSENVPHLETCPHFRREQPRHLKQKGWQKQERRANALVGARETLASGAVGKDGDGRAFREWRVEAKRTRHHYYRLTQAVWAKLVTGAKLAGEEPLLHVQWVQPLGCASLLAAPVVVITLDLYAALTGDRGPLVNQACVNRTSYRLERKMVQHPERVMLEPLGVALAEADFERLKERL